MAGRDRSRAPESWWAVIDTLPHCPGVYAVFAGKNLLYIGHTRYIYRRILQHHLRQKFIEMKVDRVECIPCESSEGEYMETWFIDKYRPPLNGRGGGWRFRSNCGCDFCKGRIPSA